ncbi:hypothetical protein KC340_g9808 [Hortaea werneckii]|nr:hypothetical protein KC340_g9808 [Hortaea werneckii]KAI7376596.1 hypothetical protein KC328_g14827 [Hortaea werneckii]
MSVPQPKGELEGHCSAIHDGTLYVRSGSTFQSLPLKENATWSEEKTGTAVKGPACVHVKSQKALYVVGGTSDDEDYEGLQRYSFADKKWETLSPPTKDLQGRTSHSAAHLEDAESILVYAGSRPDSSAQLSSSTFVINLNKPYNLEAFTSKAPPANNPILQPWNSTHAIMVGGSETNTDVFLFDHSSGWNEYSTDLTDPIDSAARGAIIDGSDGSKVLEIYDVQKSPNQVSQIVLQGADGQPASTGTKVNGNSSSKKRKRDLSLSDWPSYNSTGAPIATRTDCGLAKGPSGLSVISGGNSDLPVALFDQSDNSWVDADRFFNSKDLQEPLQPSSTSDAGAGQTASSTSSALPSVSSSSSDAGSGSGMTAHERTMRTLGITLGVLFGVAAIFIAILIYLRYRKQQQKKQEGYIDEKAGNGRLSFQDRGASFMKEAGGSIEELPPPSKDRFTQSNYPRGNGSHSSLAIIAGKIGGNANRNTGSHQPRISSESTRHLVKNKNSPHAGDPVEMMDIGDKTLARNTAVRNERGQEAAMNDYEKELVPLEARSRSSGWSKYFATSGPTGPNGISHLPAAYLKTQTTSGLSDIPSEYSDKGTKSHIPSSVLVPPLDIDFNKTLDGQRLSHVASGSPSFSDSREDLAKRGSKHEGQTGLIVNPRPDSSRSRISGYSLSSNANRTTISSNMTSDYYNESGATPWTPTTNNFKDSSYRPTSSLYTASVHEPRLPSRGKGSGFFPGAGTSYHRPPAKSTMSKVASATLPPPDEEASRPELLDPHHAAQNHDRDSTMTVFPGPGGVHDAPTSNETASKPKLLDVRQLAPTHDRDSTMTVFPRGVPSAYYANREQPEADEGAGYEDENRKPTQSNQQPVMSDMSWVNLDHGRDHDQNRF